MSYEPQNLQELAHKLTVEFFLAPDSNTAANVEASVLTALRRARTLPVDPVND